MHELLMRLVYHFANPMCGTVSWPRCCEHGGVLRGEVNFMDFLTCCTHLLVHFAAHRLAKLL